MADPNEKGLSTGIKTLVGTVIDPHALVASYVRDKHHANIEALAAVESINDKLFDAAGGMDGTNDDANRAANLMVPYILQFESNGMDFAVTFLGAVLLQSEGDEREFNEETDSYEPMEPFLIRRMKKLLEQGSFVNKLRDL